MCGKDYSGVGDSFPTEISKSNATVRNHITVDNGDNDKQRFIFQQLLGKVEETNIK